MEGLIVGEYLPYRPPHFYKHYTPYGGFDRRGILAIRTATIFITL